jgi:hypothetical protein
LIAAFTSEYDERISIGSPVKDVLGNVTVATVNIQVERILSSAARTSNLLPCCLNRYAQKRVSMVSIASVGVAKERRTAKGKRMTSRKGEQKKEGERVETNGNHQGSGVFSREMKECSDQGRETLESPAGGSGPVG